MGEQELYDQSQKEKKRRRLLLPCSTEGPNAHVATHIVDDSPPHHSVLKVVNLDELSKATGVVVVGCLGVSESLERDKKRNIRKMCVEKHAA